MRKLGILAVAALLMFALAAPLFAAETTITGNYRIRSVLDYNYDKKTNNDDLNTSYFDQRFRLTITHKRSEFLKAVVSIDLVEDMWGQQRNFRSNNMGASKYGVFKDGFINTAYIQFITKVGLFQLGTDGTSRFGMGTWSDSGLKGNGTNNAGITWGIKVDNFVATATYVKYVDFIDTVIANAAGFPPILSVWPGGATDGLGGNGSNFRDADVDTYVITARYLTDSYKVGLLYQVIRDPFAIGASYLVKGLLDYFSFAGEPIAYIYAGGHWPGPPGAIPGITDVGFGRGGMYSAWLNIVSVYADLKFIDGKLSLKAEYDRIWGTGELTGRGASYNTYLGLQGLPAFSRLPGDVKVDGHTVYADLSYDFEVAKVGVAFLYGSGEEHWRPYAQHHYNFHTTGNDDFHWGTIIVPGDSQLLGSGGAPLGLGSDPENVTSVKLYWGFDPIEKLNIHGNVIWAKYTQPVGRYANYSFLGGGLNPFRPQPFYGHPMNYALDPAGTKYYIPAKASDELGWEIDLGATYEIMEGLTLNSEFGVLFTGDAFDYQTGGPMGAGGVVHSWGPIYRWVNTLTYEF